MILFLVATIFAIQIQQVMFWQLSLRKHLQKHTMLFAQTVGTETETRRRQVQPVLSKMKKEKNKGFSLIELLVVITIIGVLIGVSFVGFSQARKSARDSKRKSDLEQIRSALEIYRNDLKTYYASDSFPFGSSFSAGTDVYMQLVPQDTLSPTYQYRYNFISANTYCICAYLETLSATQGTCDCGGNCGTAACNYKLSNP